MSLFQGTGKAYKDEDIDVASEEYVGGYTLFCLDMTFDFGECDHFSFLKTGNVRLEITFGAPLAPTIHVIVYAEFQTFWNWIEIATFSTTILPEMLNSVKIDVIEEPI